MSLLFDRVPRHELGTVFKFKGWFLGLVPVYIDDPEADEPLIAERNGVPEVWLHLVLHLWFACAWIATSLRPGFVPTFWIQTTGKLEPQR